MAQGVGPEFKPQYCQKTKKQKNSRQKKHYYEDPEDRWDKVFWKNFEKTRRS
jgi:hypothetical protein